MINKNFLCFINFADADDAAKGLFTTVNLTQKQQIPELTVILNYGMIVYVWRNWLVWIKLLFAIAECDVK